MWKSVIRPAFALLVSIASVVSVSYFFVSNQVAIIIGLLVFCLSCIGFFVYLACIINKQLKRNVYPVYTNTNFIKWEFAEDGRKSIFEVFRHIQCKKPFLSELDWNFKWSGSKTPIITSTLQRISSPIKNGNKNEYDSIRLQFPKPLFYNDTAVVHFRAELDDVDGIASPHAEFRVANPISILQFRIILKHKDSAYTQSASLMRRPIAGTGPSREEVIESVPFDRSCRTYEHHLLNPEVGYYYRLVWEK